MYVIPIKLILSTVSVDNSVQKLKFEPASRGKPYTQLKLINF